MASTRGLDERYRPVADQLIAWFRAQDPRFVITSGLRTRAEQAALFAKFQRGEGGVYTVLPPGKSQHERGFAVDIARIGTPPKEDRLLHAAGLRWRAVGGVWGGEADPVHFEAPRWLSGRA